MSRHELFAKKGETKGMKKTVSSLKILKTCTIIVTIMDLHPCRHFLLRLMINVVIPAVHELHLGVVDPSSANRCGMCSRCDQLQDLT